MDYTGRIITKNPQTPSANGAPGIWTLDEALQYSKQGKWPPGYQISRSVRLRSSASAYFNRTPSSASNRQTWTWSGWIKRGVLGSQCDLFCGDSSTTISEINIGSDDTLKFWQSGTTLARQSTAVFRDPSAWYHIVVVLDTTNATAQNRCRMYVNGVEITTWTTNNTITQNAQFGINTATAHNLGRSTAASIYFDGYLTEINFIDGQALTPASFGYFDTYTGVWQPAPYTGTYGTNGFYLTFADNSAATATTIGKDYSGNGNNWTPNNISVTNVAAPNTNDSMVDVPINWGQDTGVGGEVRGNYAVVSSVTGYAYTSSNGNLTTYGGNTNCYFSMPVTGKMYFEAYCSNLAGGGQMGFVKNASIAANTVGYNQAGYYGVNYASGAVTYWVNGTNDGINHGTISGNTMKFAVDGATGKVWIGSGSTWFGSGDPANGTNPAFTLSLLSGDLIYPMITSQSSTYTFTINTGQQPFGNAAPSGFKAMCTQNLPTPTISNGANYMAASLYTGTGASQTVSNAVNAVSFQPDLVWIKSRSAATNHKLTDSIRGATKALISNTTGSETTDTNGLTAFGSSGFTVGTDTVYNNSGATYIGWNWKANGATGVTNTAGSITSTVSVNAAAGFSIVTYTGTGTTGTVGHGLGAVPSFLVTKIRATSAGEGWPVWTSTIPNTNYMALNNTIASGSGSGIWNNTTPTSTVFSVQGGNWANINGNTMVAYLWTPIAGYSAMGSYTGNGSTDGPFVYCGFRPRFVLWKRSDSTGSWYIQDTTRSPYNQSTLSIYPNLADAETSGDDMDYLSNGFKVRDTFSYINASGGTYFYMAFAENPFTIARAR